MAGIHEILIPSLRFDEITEPDTPPTSTARLFLDEADGLLKWKDDAGAVREIGTALANPMTTEGDIITGGTSGVPERLGAGSEDDVLTIVSGVPAWAEASGGAGGADVWTYDVSVFHTPISHTGFDTITADAASVHAAWMGSDAGAQNATREFGDYYLAAGTWQLQMISSKGSNHGIYTFRLDSTDIGTIDAYNSTTLRNQRTSIGSIAVASSAVYRLSVIMATKNASSAAYWAFMNALRLRRTA
jgi:hypothetical protein